MLLSSLLFIPLLGILLICCIRSYERSSIIAALTKYDPSGDKFMFWHDFAHSASKWDFKISKLVALATSILI